MDIMGTGKRVRIYVAEQDKAPGTHTPLWEAVVEFLRKEGADGATMFRGLAGFGAHSKLHTARLADIVPDLPVLVEWIDGPERVERLLPHVCELVQSGTITVEDVDIVKYTHRAPHPVPPDRVAKVMTRELAVIHPETPVGEAVRVLLGRDFRALPVVDAAGRLVGIVTNRDLIERAGLTARLELLSALGGPALERELATSGAREKSVREVMTREVVSVAPDERLDRATHLMAEHTLKRLPVVDAAGRLVGILSRVDVLRTMGEGYHAPELEQVAAPDEVRTVGDLARRDAPVVGADAPLGAVLDAITSTRLNRAIVVDQDGRVQGIVTDADLLARLDPGGERGILSALMGRGKAAAHASGTARDVMQAPATTVSAGASVEEAARIMLEARRKVLPVVDQDARLRGVVDRADLLAYLRAAQGGREGAREGRV